MRSMEERENALNMFFYEGKGYKEIAKTLRIPLDTVKSWCRRYRIQNNIPKRGRTPLAKEPLSQETICRSKLRDDENSQEARIARLEMEVDLLRNFLILSEGR